MSEIGFKRATVIWWGFMWRSLVLTMPVVVALEALTWIFLPHVIAGVPPTHEQVKQFLDYSALIWIPGTALSAVLQIQALRWTLNTLR